MYIYWKSPHISGPVNWNSCCSRVNCNKYFYFICQENLWKTLKWAKRKLLGVLSSLAFGWPQPFIVFELFYNFRNHRKLIIMQRFLWGGKQIIIVLWILPDFTALCKFISTFLTAFACVCSLKFPLSRLECLSGFLIN